VGTHFKWDKQKIVLFYKLTDAYLAPVAQDAMKVSLAAKVVSHTVAAGLNSVASQGFIVCNEEQSYVYGCNLLSMIIFLSDFTMTMKFTTM
jgi:hypothetical protein